MNEVILNSSPFTSSYTSNKLHSLKGIINNLRLKNMTLEQQVHPIGIIGDSGVGRLTRTLDNEVILIGVEDSELTHFNSNYDTYKLTRPIPLEEPWIDPEYRNFNSKKFQLTCAKNRKKRKNRKKLKKY